MKRLTQSCFFLLAFAVLFFSIGCSRYVVAPQGADMALFGMATQDQRERLTDRGISQTLELQPLARFPTALAIARVQDGGYRAYGHRGGTYGSGQYTVVTTRSIETDEHLEKIRRLPFVQGVAPINRLVLSNDLKSDRELRDAAARLHADMILIYTFDTAVFSGDTGSPLDIVTLGFLPGKTAEVVTTASAVLLDTRNGYLYAAAEATATSNHRANAWSSRARIDEDRLTTEREAFDELVESFTQAWPGIVEQYGGAQR